MHAISRVAIIDFAICENEVRFWRIHHYTLLLTVMPTSLQLLIHINVFAPFLTLLPITVKSNICTALQLCHDAVENIIIVDNNNQTAIDDLASVVGWLAQLDPQLLDNTFRLATVTRQRRYQRFEHRNWIMSENNNNKAWLWFIWLYWLALCFQNSKGFTFRTPTSVHIAKIDTGANFRLRKWCRLSLTALQF